MSDEGLNAAPDFETALGAVLGAAVGGSSGRRVGGGSINDARRYETERGAVFVKVAQPASQETFAAEAAGLDALARARAVRTPKVLAWGRWRDSAFLALEWIDLQRPGRASETLLGEQLAGLHRSTQPLFGWDRDNTIGATPQPNTPSGDWIEFFRERRLRFQLRLASQADGGSLLERGERLCERLDAFFADHRPTPSLLHGDLWGGNWGADAEGRPVLFDPAVYYGDREADISMTRLFGGFGPAFYAAYESAWPLDPGAELRATLYNLYHVLNHFNLFGGGYLIQARSMIDRLLAEMRS